MNIAIMLMIAVLPVHSQFADACTCIHADLKQTYYSSAVTSLIRATVLAKITDPGPIPTNFFVLQTEKIYKGCDGNAITIVKSPVSSATCGIDLSVGVSYIIPLNSDAIPTLNLCQFTRPWDALSGKDLKFLQTRLVCCDGICKCADGTYPVSCFRAPCSPPTSPPCKEAVKCIDNYCGGCNAEWVDKHGRCAC